MGGFPSGRKEKGGRFTEADRHLNRRTPARRDMWRHPVRTGGKRGSGGVRRSKRPLPMVNMRSPPSDAAKITSCYESEMGAVANRGLRDAEALVMPRAGSGSRKSGKTFHARRPEWRRNSDDSGFAQERKGHWPHRGGKRRDHCRGEERGSRRPQAII